MIILFEPSFRDSYYNAPESDIALRYYKLKELGTQNISELKSRPEMMAEAGFIQGTSPTLGYYNYSAIKDSEKLQITLNPPGSDYSVEKYNTVMFIYEDLVSETSGVGFVIILEREENKEPEILRRALNYIDIYGFDPKCKVTYERTLDTERLEGPGQGRWQGMWSKRDKDAFITLESWKAWNQIYRSKDELDHLDTAWINEYGLKQY